MVAQRKDPTRSEHAQQVEFFRYVNARIKTSCGSVRDAYESIFAVPNAAKRNYKTASYMRAEGMRAGVPDVVIPVPRFPFHGLYIEHKIKPNRPSEVQKQWIARLQRLGHLVLISYSATESINILERYLNGHYGKEDHTGREASGDARDKTTPAPTDNNR